MGKCSLNLARECFWIFGVVLLTNYSEPGNTVAQESPHNNMKLNCEACHVPISWTEIRFDHSRTEFPLQDRHKEVDCSSCHDIEDFSKTTSDCNNCHQDVHQAKMGNNCEQCHAFRGWEIFNVEEIHTNTQFPLMGRHTLVDCQSCHQNQQQGDFALLTTDCVACHHQAYLATENPNHVANSFSTTCQECHDMNGWRPAFLPNHDAFFPVFVGEHEGAWSDCMDCHINPPTFSDFSCLNCHKHRQDKMDEEHRGITGYAYESNACFSCHPTGGKADVSKNHDADFFPIFSGTHQEAWQECAECHVSAGAFQVVSCTDCHAHERSKTDSEHSGMTGYAYATENCLICHPTGIKGDFADHDRFFPISTGPHDRACIDCHVEPTNPTVFECILCHSHNQQKMDDKHLGKVKDYVYESTACYDCHPDGKE